MLPEDFYEDVKSTCIRESRNTENVFLSITIPTYKRNKFLEEAIESALNQDFKNVDLKYEVIVVNNDPEADMNYFIEKYKNVDNIAFYVNEKNIGMVGNMNRCAMLAKGKYVAYLHDDDLLKPNYIKEISKVLFNDKYNDAICITNGWDLIQLKQDYEQKQVQQNQISLKRIIKTAGRRTIETLINFIFAFRYLYRKDIIELTPELTLRASYGNIYRAPTCGTVFNKEKFFASGGWTDEGGLSFDYYSFLRFNEQFKIYMIKASLGTYRNGYNTSSMRSTQIAFCINGCISMDKKYKSEKVNKYFDKYRDILKYMRIICLNPNEQEEVYKTLNLKKYTPSFLKLTLFRLKTYCYVKIHNLDHFFNIGF